MEDGSTQNQQPSKQDKLAKDLFTALKRDLIGVAPKVPGKEKGSFVPDPKSVAAIQALKVEDIEVVSVSKDKSTYVVHAGVFGVRKVTL